VRRSLLVFALAVFAMSALAPIAEALAPCLEECQSDGPGDDCATDQCCSCCVHSRLVSPQCLGKAKPLSRSSRVVSATLAPAAAADPREILHIPKPLSA
jgi:hypothetical protein